MIERAKTFVKDEDGATAIEYGLIAALISVVIIVAVTSAGSSLDTLFGAIDTSLTDAVEALPDAEDD